MQANAISGPERGERAFEWRFGCAHRVFQVRARGGARERHWPSVPAFVGPQGEKGELDGTKREPRWFLHSNPMSGGRELLGGDDGGFECLTSPATKEGARLHQKSLHTMGLALYLDEVCGCFITRGLAVKGRVSQDLTSTRC